MTIWTYDDKAQCVVRDGMPYVTIFARGRRLEVKDDHYRGEQMTCAIQACEELIRGDGTDASLQLTINLARKALGVDAL